MVSLTAILLAAGCKRQLHPEEAKGARLYQANCRACHENPPEGLLKTPPRLEGIFHKSTLPDGVPVSDQAVHDVILQGLRTMPAFNGRLHEDEVQAIVAYLHVYD